MCHKADLFEASVGISRDLPTKKSMPLDQGEGM